MKQLTNSIHRDINTRQVHQPMSQGAASTPACSWHTALCLSQKPRRGEGSLHGVDVTPLLEIVICLSCVEGCMPPNGKQREISTSKTLTVVTQTKCCCGTKAVMCPDRISLVGSVFADCSPDTTLSHQLKTAKKSIKVFHCSLTAAFLQVSPDIQLGNMAERRVSDFWAWVLHKLLPCKDHRNSLGFPQFLL